MRTLAVLLNYERTTTDPRFVGRYLCDHTPTHYRKHFPSFIPLKVGDGKSQLYQTVRSTHEFNFSDHKKPRPNDTPTPTTCEIDPNCSDSVKSLCKRRLEVLFHETRNLDGCLRALSVYHHFLQLCSEDQLFSIRITDEEPVLVKCNPAIVTGLKLYKLRMISTIQLGQPDSELAIETELECDGSAQQHFVSFMQSIAKDALHLNAVKQASNCGGESQSHLLMEPIQIISYSDIENPEISYFLDLTRMKWGRR